MGKRSAQKDYCPGYLDLQFGGVVPREETTDPIKTARREVVEELGIEDLSEAGLKFVTKLKYDSHAKSCWSYLY